MERVKKNVRDWRDYLFPISLFSYTCGCNTVINNHIFDALCILQFNSYASKRRTNRYRAATQPINKRVQPFSSVSFPISLWIRQSDNFPHFWVRMQFFQSILFFFATVYYNLNVRSAWWRFVRLLLFSLFLHCH